MLFPRIKNNVYNEEETLSYKIKFMEVYVMKNLKNVAGTVGCLGSSLVSLIGTVKLIADIIRKDNPAVSIAMLVGGCVGTLVTFPTYTETLIDLTLRHYCKDEDEEDE